MSGGGSSTTQTRLDPNIARITNENYAFAQQVAGLPYQPYYGMYDMYNYGMQPSTTTSGTGTTTGTTSSTGTTSGAWAPFSGGATNYWQYPATGGIAYPGMTRGSTPTTTTQQSNTPQMAYGTIDPLRAAQARVAGLSPEQMLAQQYGMQFATGNMGADQMQSALNTTQGVSQYSPLGVSPLGYFGANTVDRSQIGNVYGGIAAGGIGNYMNPYTGEVIDAALGDLDRSRQMTQNQNAASATAAGAFGGSRHGVVEAETNRAYADQASQMAAQLRNAGFQTALGASQNDLARALAAQQSNQQVDYGSALANMQAMNQGNQYYGNQYLQAMLANQQAGLQGGALNLQAANQLANMTDAQRAQSLQNYQLMQSIGGQNQAYDQQLMDAAYAAFQQAQGYPLQQLSILQSALSQSPYGSSQTTTESGGNPLAGAIGGGLGGYAMASMAGMANPMMMALMLGGAGLLGSK